MKDLGYLKEKRIGDSDTDHTSTDNTDFVATISDWFRRLAKELFSQTWRTKIRINNRFVLNFNDIRFIHTSIDFKRSISQNRLHLTSPRLTLLLNYLSEIYQNCQKSMFEFANCHIRITLLT